MRVHSPLVGLAYVATYLLTGVNADSLDEAPGTRKDYQSDCNIPETSWLNQFPPFEGLGTPHPFINESEVALSGPGDLDLRKRQSNPKPFYLRILPLGASIVQGVESSDRNGFRKLLRNQLRWKGWPVNMVGSKQDGTMADKDNEGHPGLRIDEIQVKFNNIKGALPNVVLLNAGTNDCNQNWNLNSAKARYKGLLENIFGSIPGVTVIASTLVNSRDHQKCATDLSGDIRNLVNVDFKGSKIVLADIDAAMDKSNGGVMSNDGIHPNDAGYRLFAAVWWAAIEFADGKGMLSAPAYVASIDDTKSSPSSTCSKVAGNARGPIQSQKGSGHDNGLYVHDRKEPVIIESGRIQKNSDPAVITNGIPDRVFFANVVAFNNKAEYKEMLDDWIRVFHALDGKNTYYYRQNNGGGVFGPSTTFSVDMNCDSGPKYAFADFNGDGLADFWCIRIGSNIEISINQGTNPPTFKYFKEVVGSHAGFSDRSVRIGDIDGDGRADYCLVETNGYLKCSRNGGKGTDYFWQGFNTATGVTERVFDRYATDDNAGVTLGDINADGRADFLYIGNNGNVNTIINQRGWGKGILPDWIPVGITHLGQGETNIARNIKFGRIFGTGMLDYIYLKEEKTYYDMKVWQNNAGGGNPGGTRRKGDGVFYCDMTGSGRDDYVWIWSDGHAAEIYINTKNPPFWGNDHKIELNVNHNRVGIHLGDWDGDGRCDVLVQDKATGAITPWINQYDAGAKTIRFTKTAATRGMCDQGWGLSIFDRGMRVGDLDGDGRVDILCLYKDGRIFGTLNKPGRLQDLGQIKRSEGWDRANIRVADVENSGRVDIIWLDKYTGAGKVWRNDRMANANEIAGNSGSAMWWTPRDVLYSPISRGETMHFANQGGLGRADLIEVLPVSNTAYTYFNECPGSSGGDDGPLVDPQLPSYSQPGNGPAYTDIKECFADKNKYFQIEAIPASIPLICRVYYILIIWRRRSIELLGQYQNLMRDDYDRKFEFYAKYLVDGAPDRIKKITQDDGQDYFDCDVYEKIYCCRTCRNLWSEQECRYCAANDGTNAICKVPDPQFGEPPFEYQPRREPCPPNYNDRGMGGNDKQSIKWFLRRESADAFYDAIGMESQFVEFGDYTFDRGSTAEQNTCARNPEQDICKYKWRYYQYPVPADSYTAKSIDNPKEFINNALPDVQNLIDRLGNLLLAMENKRQYEDGVDAQDVAWAVMPTVFMLDQAVSKMQVFLENAEKAEKAETLKAVFAFLDTFFLLVPFFGSALTTASTTIKGIARVATGFADAYAVGKGIYDSATGNPVAGILSIVGFGAGKAAWSSGAAKGVSSQVKLFDAAGFGAFEGPFKTVSKAMEEKLKPDEDQDTPPS